MSIRCTTVGELIAALSDLPFEAPIATLYDWGADVKFGITVNGYCNQADEDGSDICLGHVVLDIDPEPH